MIWLQHERLGNTLRSECETYRITNFGKKKGGNQYCLWKVRRNAIVVDGLFRDVWCQLVTIGTGKHCKEFLDEPS